MNYQTSILVLGLLLCHSLTCQPVDKNSEWAQSQPYVVMLSLDGFRYDYSEKFNATNLLQFKEEGAWTKRMQPSFPSKTFPNHYTLATGLTPANHGLVGNSFYSRSKNESYNLRDREVVEDGSWYGGLPIWMLAEQNGMLAASYFWVGSEAKGKRPTYWNRYDSSVPNENRANQVVDWLKLPREVRPHLITFYFSIVDDFGHRYGPSDKRTQEVVLQIDKLIGDLFKELKRLDLPIYLIVTSDHGMVDINRGISVQDVNFGQAVVDISSTMLMVYSENVSEISTIREQLEAKDQLQVFSKEEIKEMYGFDNEDRVGDLVALCNPPAIILKSPRPVWGGTHGFDPEVDEMGTIFYMTGPNVKPGYEIPSFSNVHVYPLIAYLLGLKFTHTIDGDLDVLRPALTE